MKKKEILLISATVIFLLCSPFVKNMVIDIELQRLREWMILPFWALGVLVAVLLSVISIPNSKADFIRNATNRNAGSLLAIPGLLILCYGCSDNPFVTQTRFPFFGVLSESCLGALTTIFVFSLIRWSVSFVLVRKDAEKKSKKEWFDFFNLKFKDLVWLVLPLALGYLDPWILVLARSLREHMMSFMPKLTTGPLNIPIYVRIFAGEVVPSILYLIICTAIFMFLCNYEKINKAVAITVIGLCVFGVLRYYLRLFNFSGDLVNKLILNGLPVSAVLLSMPLAISIKSLLPHKAK